MQNNNNGAALISAIFITAIAAVIATALAMQQRLLIHESELIFRSDQAYLNLAAMQSVTRIAVKKYANQFLISNAKISVIPLTTQLPLMQFNHMTLFGLIDNEGGKFNLNDLVFAANQLRFVAFVQAVIPGYSSEKAEAIAKSMTTWMMNGAEDSYYLSLDPPYRSSLQEFSNISELRLIKGMTSVLYSALKPYVTALPIQKPELSAQSGSVAGTTPIDINSVSAPVLMSMNTAMNLSQARTIVVCRDAQGAFRDVNTFITQCVNPSGITTLSDASVSSNYFLSRVGTTIGDHTVQLKSLLVTQPEKNNTLAVNIVWQSYD